MDHLTTFRTAPLLCPLLLLAACGGGPAPGTVTNSIQPAAMTMQASSTGYGTEYPYVGASELQCVEDDFAAHIHQGEVQDHAPIQPRVLPLELRVEELQGLVDQLACNNGSDIGHGVVLHYGLDSDLRFDVMLQVLCLAYDPNDSTYTYAEEAHGYTLDGSGGLVYDSLALSAWYNVGGRGHRYAQKVVIRHDTDGPWAAFDADVDVHATIFPYEQRIQALITDNTLDGRYLLRIVPIALPMTREEVGKDSYLETGFHQSAAWVPVDLRLDDTVDSNAPYRNKAADAGMPCPDTCPQASFRFSQQGLKKRDGC